MDQVYALKFKIGCLLSLVCQFCCIGVMIRFLPIWLHCVTISCYKSTCNFATTYAFTQNKVSLVPKPFWIILQPFGPWQCRLSLYANAYLFLPFFGCQYGCPYLKINKFSTQQRNISKYPQCLCLFSHAMQVMHAHAMLPS